MVCGPVPYIDAAAGLLLYLCKRGADARLADQAAEQLAIVATHKTHGRDPLARKGRHAGHVHPFASRGVDHLLNAGDRKGLHFIYNIQLIHRAVQGNGKYHGKTSLPVHQHDLAMDCFRMMEQVKGLRRLR